MYAAFIVLCFVSALTTAEWFPSVDSELDLAPLKDVDMTALTRHRREAANITAPVESEELESEVTDAGFTEGGSMVRKSLKKRSIGANRNKMWPRVCNNGRCFVEVPYNNLDLEPEVEILFNKTVEEFATKSCIRWMPKTYQNQFVTISRIQLPNLDPYSCFAIIGRNWNTYMYLSSMCLGLAPNSGQWRAFNVAHEMMHVLNFIHEHQRKDRDCFVAIDRRSIQRDFLAYGHYVQQNIQDTEETFPYDIDSVMQYSNDQHIESLFGKRLGPKNGSMSKMDWMKINYYYCGGPHYCDLYQEQCAQFNNILQRCKRRRG